MEPSGNAKGAWLGTPDVCSLKILPAGPKAKLIGSYHAPLHPMRRRPYIKPRERALLVRPELNKLAATTSARSNS